MENRDTLLLFRHFFCRYFKRVRSTAIWLRVLSGLTSFFIFLAFLFFFLFFVDLRFVKKEKKTQPLELWTIAYRFDEQRLTLRIHRGRGSVHNGSNNGSPRSPESNSRSSVKREKIKISVSYPSTETLNTKCNTLERTPSRCSQTSVHYSNGQTHSQLCPSPRNTHLKVIPRITLYWPSSKWPRCHIFTFSDGSYRLKLSYPGE